MTREWDLGTSIDNQLSSELAAPHGPGMNQTNR